jgi:Tol biopolymer transport system component
MGPPGKTELERRVVSDHPQRLESWKDIAAYLRRDVSTVQRWEKREGMPVHRHQHDKLGSVYAFPAELDAWAHGRRTATEGPPDPLPATASPTVEAQERTRVPLVVAGLAILAIAVVAIVVWLAKRPPQNPFANARFTRLTDFEGTENAAAISRDGRFVAFLSDREGPLDVWLTQIGTGQFHNLTKGTLSELVNPDIRVLGFSPDGALVLVWVRRQRPAGKPDISIWAIPTLGGEPRLYLEGAAEAEWSHDGSRLVYHTPAPGDPMFLRDKDSAVARKIFGAREGIHNHYQVWSPDDQSIYFVHGPVPNENDIWRIRPDDGALERMSSHDTRVSYLTFVDPRTLMYLATDADGGGPWLFALDPQRRQSRRISFGVERYTSLAASADGRRLVATVTNPRRTLWRVPIGQALPEAKDATRVTVPIAAGRAPRVAPGYLLYVSSRGDADTIWKLSGGSASELWSAAGARIIGGPAVTPDGKRVAFTVEERGRRRLYVMGADGSGGRAMFDTLEPRGEPAWSPDGRSLVVEANGSRLVVASLADGKITLLPPGYATAPVWARDGRTIVYSGPEVGTTFPIQSVGLDGRIRQEPPITLSRGNRRLVFLPAQNTVVALRGDMIHKDFWAIDLSSGAERRLTNLGPEFLVGDFDVSPDGKEIVFDREQDSSDIVLIDR